MSMKIENCKPIEFRTEVPNLTLSEIKTLLPEAIDLIGSYTYNGACYYLVVMPYTFTAPTSPVFGDRLEINVNVGSGIEYNSTDPIPQGLILVSQFVNYIYDYNH